MDDIIIIAGIVIVFLVIFRNRNCNRWCVVKENFGCRRETMITTVDVDLLLY